MSSLGYAAKDYTKWTVNNFGYTVSNVGNQTSEKDYAGTITYLRATLVSYNPSLSYTASSGTLSITKCYYQGNAVTKVSGTNRMQTAYNYPTVKIFLYTIKK